VPLNVATVAGGVAINVVPDRCTLELGFRPLPGSDIVEVRDRAEAAIRGAAPTATIELAGYSEPLLTEKASRVHRELCHLVGQSAGRGAPFATDGGPLSALDLDIVVWGPGSIEVAHRADEWMPKVELHRCAELLPALVDRFCR
jgi:acetylornithine deacetylase